MPVIELHNVGRTYQVGETALQVLKGISLTIDEGEFVAIMGPSGSGKSTLMQIMGLLDRPTSGRYLLLGRDVSRLTDDEGAALRSKTIGFIFQMFNLLQRTSAFDNVILPMIYAGRNNRNERANELLGEVGLLDRRDHKPNQLSGGQQQRVAIARALVNNPRIIFADEPTGNLASDQAEEILQSLGRLNARGITTIMVTHEPEIAAHARRVIHIKDGVIVADEKKAPTHGKPAGAAALEKSGAGETEMPGFTGAEISEHARTAFNAIVSSKVRSALSVLGVLIGVAAVITMLAIGRGAQQAIQARLQSMGSNVVMMFAGSPSTRGIRGAAGAYTRLTLNDVRAIKKLSSVVDIYGENEGNVHIVYGNRNEVAEVQGVPPNYASIRNANPYYGRFFTEEEDAARARVILLGQTVVSQLFGKENPVDKMVKINHMGFRVIGILPVKGSNGFSDQDDMAVIPIHTGMKRVFGTPYLHEMAIQCASPEAIPAMMAAIRHLMRKRHRLPDFKEDDFTLRNNAEMQSVLSGTTKTMSSLLGIVAAISLLVGGVGIMNIMLVSVNERTREIGLRKAVGAARRAILLQFLLEALILSTIGGTLGIALGVSLSMGLAQWAGWAAQVVPSSTVVAFLFSAGVGVAFGFWPAYKASLLSPIEALRYE